MKAKAEKAFNLAGELGDLIIAMKSGTSDLDLQRLLKQIDADLMDLRHKLSSALKLTEKE